MGMVVGIGLKVDKKSLDKIERKIKHKLIVAVSTDSGLVEFVKDRYIEILKRNLTEDDNILTQNLLDNINVEFEQGDRYDKFQYVINMPYYWKMVEYGAAPHKPHPKLFRITLWVMNKYDPYIARKNIRDNKKEGQRKWTLPHAVYRFILNRMANGLEPHPFKRRATYEVKEDVKNEYNQYIYVNTRVELRETDKHSY